jgi:Integrase
MGALADAVHQIKKINARLGGSTRTQENRLQHLTGLLEFARRLKALPSSPAEIDPWIVHAYAAHCSGAGKQPGNLGNIFCSIRVVLRELGVDIDGTCTNRQLGLPRRIRKGARRAPTHAEFDDLLERAALIDEGLLHMIALANELGLRLVEALMCARDLRMWLDALASGKTVIDVMRGAKNLRPRQAEVLEARRTHTLKVVEAALTYALAHNYELITGRGRTLKSAVNRVKSLVRQAGMKGELSFHCLRYSYSQTLAVQLLDAGVSPLDTLVRVSASLGHGATRTQMILNYYCQPIADRFEGCLKGKDNAARTAETPLPRAAARREAKLRHARLSGHPIGRMELTSTQPAGATGDAPGNADCEATYRSSVRRKRKSRTQSR